MMFQKEQMATGIFAYTAYTRNRIYIYMIHYDICIYIYTLYIVTTKKVEQVIHLPTF